VSNFVIVILVIVSSINFPTLAFAAATKTVSLSEAFQQAAKLTEPLPIQEQSIRQAEEKISQVRGSVFPSLTLLGSYQKQDNSDVGGVNAFTRPDQQSVRLALVQPLFRGLREFAEWRSAEDQLNAQKQLGEQARLNLFAQVSEAYYGVLQAEKDLTNLKTLLELTEQRVRELQGRVKIGRSRRGELLTSQAQVATLGAQIESALSQVEQARETFTALTALPSDVNFQEGPEALPAALEPLDSFVLKVDKRPDIAAQRSLEQAAEEKIDSAWGAHLPSLDLTGNYYFKRTGILENVKWDVSLNLSIPIFQGGVINSQVREASELHKQQSLRLSQLRRNAVREIRTLHVSLTRSLSQYRALKTALSTAEQNYKEQHHDYQFGLVTNLDVIQALNTFQETKRQLDRLYYDAKQTECTLLAAVGIIP